MSTEQPRFVSPHIEKTGGISLMKFFIDLYGPEMVYQYMPETGFIRADKNPTVARLNPKSERIKSLLLANPLSRKMYPFLRRLIHNAEHPISVCEVPDNFAIIHGHFSPAEAPVKDAKLITVFREPLVRTLSHYNYWVEAEQKGAQTAEWFSPHMSFAEFALNEHMVNFQSKRIGPAGIGQFEHIGITEDLSAYCKIFDPEGCVPLPWLNKTHTMRQEGNNFDPNFISEYNDHHSDDIELYQSALDTIYSR